MLKKVAEASLAIAFPINVFPVPGGPKRRMALGGALRPVKMSGLNIGHTIISWIIFFAKPSPAIEFHLTSSPFSRMSDRMMLTSFCSRFLNAGSLHCYSSSFSSTSFKFPSGFLKGGTNFFRIEVPLGKTPAETNYPGGTTALAAIGIYGGLNPWNYLCWEGARILLFLGLISTTLFSNFSSFAEIFYVFSVLHLTLNFLFLGYSFTSRWSISGDKLFWFSSKKAPKCYLFLFSINNTSNLNSSVKILSPKGFSWLLNCSVKASRMVLNYVSSWSC